MRLPYIVITCARIDSIKCVYSEPPCCSGGFLDLLSIHDSLLLINSTSNALYIKYLKMTEVSVEACLAKLKVLSFSLNF